jgi:hypothetical protein
MSYTPQNYLIVNDHFAPTVMTVYQNRGDFYKIAILYLMLQKIKNNPTLKMLINTRNIGLYLLVIITLSVSWSTIKAIQKNYDIEKQITTLTQEVDILDQETKNQALKNDYYRTDAFLDLAVRKYFSKALPGEQFISVPNQVADKYTHPEATASTDSKSSKPKPQIIQNWQDWINFFLHRSE